MNNKKNNKSKKRALDVYVFTYRVLWSAMREKCPLAIILAFGFYYARHTVYPTSIANY